MHLLLLLACGTVEQPPTPLERCRAGEAAVCLGLGLREEACIAGEGRTCWELGMHARWEAGDPVGAFTLFDRGCTAGDPMACLAAGDALRRGEGTERSFTAAEHRYERACSALPLACDLARHAVALSGWIDACVDGADAACRLACAEGEGPACDRAVEGLRADCDAGEADACTLLGTAIGRGWTTGTPDEANVLLWRGCDLDDPWGCLRLHDRVARGEGHNPSPKELAWLENQVCDLQLWYGCAPHP